VKKKSKSGGGKQASKQRNLDELRQSAKDKERRERLAALADGRKQRKQVFKTPKDYDRKENNWREEHE
jgi:heme oxygenase